MTTAVAVAPAPEEPMESNLDSSMYNKLTKNKLHCTVCDKIVSSRSSESHMRMHAGTQPYSCPICNKKFAHRSSVNRHKKSHDKAQLFQCSACDKTFTSKCTFDIHLELHKNAEAGPTYPCSLCEKAFTSGEQLVEHMAEHGQLQYIQVTDSNGKSEIRLAPVNFTTIPDTTKTAETLLTTASLEAPRDANGIPTSVVSTTVQGTTVSTNELVMDTYQKQADGSDGLLYQEVDAQRYQTLLTKDVPTQPQTALSGQKFYLLAEPRERDRVELVQEQDQRVNTTVNDHPIEQVEQDVPQDDQPEPARDLKIQNQDIMVSDECILRKMLASKIVGSVNALTAKRGLPSNLGRLPLDLDFDRKYAVDLLSSEAYQKAPERLEAPLKSPGVEEVSHERKDPSPAPPQSIQELTPVLDLAYTHTDEANITQELTYLNNVDLRTKIPQIRYFVNLRKPGIMYATKEDAIASAKEYPEEVQNAHIIHNVHDLQNLQNITILQNAQLLQNAHILQTAEALVGVDPSLLERRAFVDQLPLTDQIQASTRVETEEKIDSRQIYQYEESHSLEKQNHSPQPREGIMYAETAPVAVNRIDASQTLSDGKIHDQEEQIHQQEHRRETSSHSELPPKSDTETTTEQDDPYSFNLSGTSRDSASFPDVGSVGTNSPEGATNGAASVVHTTPSPKRSRRSGSSSSKRNRSEAGYKSFKCTSCDRYFPCSSALDRHRQSKHPPHVVCHTCTICGKALYHPSHIYIHMRTHV